MLDCHAEASQNRSLSTATDVPGLGDLGFISTRALHCQHLGSGLHPVLHLAANTDLRFSPADGGPHITAASLNISTSTKMALASVPLRRTKRTALPPAPCTLSSLLPPREPVPKKHVCAAFTHLLYDLSSPPGTQNLPPAPPLLTGLHQLQSTVSVPLSCSGQHPPYLGSQAMPPQTLASFPALGRPHTSMLTR